ncbi:hypothetical protein BaRGS_00030037, partial [Batillaria attramentaria]
FAWLIDRCSSTPDQLFRGFSTTGLASGGKRDSRQGSYYQPAHDPGQEIGCGTRVSYRWKNDGRRPLYRLHQRPARIDTCPVTLRDQLGAICCTRRTEVDSVRSDRIL